MLLANLFVLRNILISTNQAESNQTWTGVPGNRVEHNGEEEGKVVPPCPGSGLSAVHLYVSNELDLHLVLNIERDFQETDGVGSRSSFSHLLTSDCSFCMQLSRVLRVSSIVCRTFMLATSLVYDRLYWPGANQILARLWFPRNYVCKMKNSGIGVQRSILVRLR